MATVISSSRELSSQEAAIVVKTLDSLGFIIKKEKSVLIPSQIMVFLGYVIDSVEMTVSLPEEKLNRLKKTNIVLVWERPHCSIRELAHELAHWVIVHSFPAIRPDRLYYRDLVRSLPFIYSPPFEPAPRASLLADFARLKRRLGKTTWRL